MIVPLGLTLIVFMTEFRGRRPQEAHDKGLGNVLSFVVFRLTLSLLIISGIIGLLVPAILGYALPESHIAEGPWGYEEIIGFFLAGMCLWRSRQHDAFGMHLRLLWLGCAVLLLLGVGMLWVGRWDMMAHEGQVAGGWFLQEFLPLEWNRVAPKMLHLLFSGLAAGGVVVTLIGLVGWPENHSEPESQSGLTTGPSPSIVRYGVGWILAGLVPQMLVGPWLFLMLDAMPRSTLIDGAGLASMVFFVSVTAALLALVLLNASFMAPYVSGLVWGGLISLMFTLVFMGIIRYLVFRATLHARGIPIGIDREVTGFHLLTVLILTGLLGVILFRWAVAPVASSSHSVQRLDKRWTSN